MWSTKTTGATCRYLGVDITDRYVDAPRPMDVCGIELRHGSLVPHFWTWSWGASGPVDVSALLSEVNSARAVMLDGPQGLARIRCAIRSAERSLAAAGKTSDIRPPSNRPYGGFIASSLDLLAAFHRAGLVPGSASSTRVCEVYPAAIWTRLARRLSNKRRRAGREARAALLEALGIALPGNAPGHDALDACAAALLGAVSSSRASARCHRGAGAWLKLGAAWQPSYDLPAVASVERRPPLHQGATSGRPRASRERRLAERAGCALWALGPVSRSPLEAARPNPWAGSWRRERDSHCGLRRGH